MRRARAQFAPNSLFLFDESSVIRQAAVWITQWPWFERFVLLVIFFNTVCLAIEDYRPGSVDHTTYSPDPTKSVYNAFTAQADYYNIAVFATEMVLKIIAMGFFVDKGSYLRDAWNWLDFIVVIMG